MTRRAFILRGEGIECEEELFRFLSLPELGFECAYVNLPELLENPEETLFKKLKTSDWVFFPGGFSFADHFGSGRLLSFELARIHFFQTLIDKKCHLFGICNGFQVLTQAGLFGESIRLVHNHDTVGKPLGFQNQWVNTYSPSMNDETFRLCVRHGEGALSLGQATGLTKGVKPFLKYCDPYFENGSFEKIAGLVADVGDSKVFGMMPHPEVAARPIDDPDYAGPDFLPQNRHVKMKSSGDGIRFFKKLLETEGV